MPFVVDLEFIKIHYYRKGMFYRILFFYLIVVTLFTLVFVSSFAGNSFIS